MHVSIRPVHVGIVGGGVTASKKLCTGRAQAWNPSIGSLVVMLTEGQFSEHCHVILCPYFPLQREFQGQNVPTKASVCQANIRAGTARHRGSPQGQGKVARLQAET
ncbi:unnamed protein product [Boreogadus saida]